MDYRNRIGHFIALAGAISLFVFWTSLYTPDKKYNYPAFLIGIILLWIGLPLRRVKRPAPPAKPSPAPPTAPTPAKQSAPASAPKKPGLLTTILKGPPPKKTAAPPPPPPAAPPAPPPKKGLAGLFAPKPKK